MLVYLLTDRVAEYSDEDEEAEFSSGEFNDESNELAITGYDQKRDYNPAKHDMRKYRNKLQRSGIEDIAIVGHHPHPVDSDSEFEMKDKSSSRAKFSRVSHSTDTTSYTHIIIAYILYKHTYVYRVSFNRCVPICPPTYLK